MKLPVKMEEQMEGLEIVDLISCSSEEDTPKTSTVEPQAKEIEYRYEDNELPKIRKKVCQKIYSILLKEFNIDKKNSKIAT